MTNRHGSRSGATGGPTPLAQGWQRPQSKAHQGPKGDTVVGRRTARVLTGTVSVLPKRSRVGIVRPPPDSRGTLRNIPYKDSGRAAAGPSFPGLLLENSALT